MKRFIFILILCIAAINIQAQDQAAQSDTLRKDALNVYMQANDYIRQEIVFVNFVRDIQDADVYIISTNQRTGSGGNEYTYYITGQRAFAGMADTVIYVSSPDDTQDVIREKSVRTLKMGLMRFIVKTPLAEYITIGFSQKISETVTTDNWNSWVFRTQINGNFRGEETSKSNSLSGNFSANRITKDWKISLRANYNKNTGKYSTGTFKYTRETISQSANALIVKSISDHWSIGGSSSLSVQSVNNQKSVMSILPGIEYDIFPYSESTRRQFRILYRAGFSYVNYVDTTRYNKINESLWSHSLTASYEILEKWGSIEFISAYRNYLHNWSMNNLSVDAYLSLRVAKGLSLSLSGGASLIHDQLYLAKGEATPEEILTQTKKLPSYYDYYTSFGVTYTFGSIYNNVVNPRFGN